MTSMGFQSVFLSFSGWSIALLPFLSHYTVIGEGLEELQGTGCTWQSDMALMSAKCREMQPRAANWVINL
ncbi:hypothetical protein XELAEV_18027480mg [Xenopus laevis]|uniref:Secreted protein n=1 Tax=Xenopus laevis TaxID=8355 RepID=A0A974CY53_XENLA|nr:hypothetical protein XELAEV_18027480mg [Xenopus laevis]